MTPEEKRAYKIQWDKNNPEKLKGYYRKWYSENKEKVKEYREENKERILDYARTYRQENKEAVEKLRKEKGKEWNKKYRDKNKEALKEKGKKWYSENKEKVKEYQKKNRDSAVLRNIKHRASKLGLPFNLTVEDIQNPGICPVVGIKMERGPVKDFKTSPSVDRIIPELGYVKGNIQVISNKANTMKNDATPEELRMFARWVLKTFPEESDGKA